MAKRKTRKVVNNDNSVKIDILGLFLILIAIVGCCKFQPLSDVINGFAGFLVGVLWGILLIGVGLIGFYMVVKRKVPFLLTTKLFGLYIIFLGILCFCHLGYINKLEIGNSISYEKVFSETLKEIKKSGLVAISDIKRGDIAATESIIDYLQRMFDGNIQAFIPQLAMSAGTMIACSTKCIYMGKESSIGPIDPQFGGIPCHSILKEFVFS